MAQATKSLRAIFDEASEIENEYERQAYLDQACGTDTTLRARVESLLRSEARAGGFLADPKRHATSARFVESEGDQIGRYKLIQRLGEGGCGVVYLADQTQPVRRPVALKIIKLGMDTRSVVARFEAERQALALMDHPNIARVFDAGATDAGRPFFVMELVRGIKITDYCNEKRLCLAARLQLFMQVCHAVQHAHQKGIIHRDLKPSNILVTSDDGVPLPKVIDFGIAKATAEVQLTDKTLFTRLDMFIGTPAYMSPEQAEFAASDIDTRTDIYSLGVLLYELLTGHPPFESERWLATGIDTLRQGIRETEPPRPSTCLTQQLLASSPHCGSATSQIANLKSQIQSDLDWIVLKALEKDRNRRYQTAADFAADVWRHLNSEPVMARPPSSLYVFGKLVRRHRLAFVSACAATLLVLAGVLLIVRDATLTRRAEKVQRELRERAEQAKDQADAANKRLTRELFLREWQDAETLLEQGKIAAALAWFAQAARAHPDDAAVQTRLLSILTENTFALPLARLPAQGASMTSGAFSADQQRFITSAEDGRVRIWPIGSDAAPLILPHLFSSPTVALASGDRIFVDDAESVSLWGLNGALIQRVAFRHHVGRRAQATSDGRLVASNGGEQIWETTDLRPVQRPAFDSATEVNPAGISPDGRYLFGSGSGARFCAWELSSGRQVWEADSLGAEYIADFDISTDGRRVVLSHAIKAGDKLSEWSFEPDSDRRNGNLKVLPRALVPVRRQVTVLKFAPGGDRLFAGDLEGQIGTVHLTRSEFQLFNGEHDGRVNWMGISADGQRLATASVDGTARLWDVRMKIPEPRLFTNGPTIWDARFSPDSRTFALAGMDALEIRNSSSGALLQRLPMRQLITCLDFSHDGRRIVAGGSAGETRVWVTDTGEPVTPILRGEANHHVEFSPDDRHFLVVTGAGQATVRVHKSDTGRQVGPTLTNRAVAIGAHFSPDGRAILATPETGDIELWSWLEGRRLARPRGHKDVIWSARFSLDGSKLLTASRDRTAALWKLDTGQLVREFPHDQQVYNAAFSPDGRRIATGDASRVAHVWDTETGRRLFDLLPHPGGVWYVEFSPDGHFLLTGDETGAARVWDASSGLPLSGWVRNGRSLKRVRFSPDGRLALSASDSGTVRVWPAIVGPLPAPTWLPDLAEALAGRRLREVAGPAKHWQTLSASLSALEGNDFYPRWARWFFVERMKEKPAAFAP